MISADENKFFIHGEQLAALLGTSETNLRVMTHAGNFPSKVYSGRKRGWNLRTVIKFLFEKCNKVSDNLKDQIEKEKVRKLSRENRLAEQNVIPIEIHDENLINSAKLFKNLLKRTARDSGYELAGLTSTAEEINHKIIMVFHKNWKASGDELSFKETIDDAVSNIEKN